MTPWFPSPTYIRVLPFLRVFNANVDRSVLRSGWSAGLIWAQVVPPSVDRQTPIWNAAA